MEHTQSSDEVRGTVSVWIIEDSADYREELSRLFQLDGTVSCEKIFGSYEEARDYLINHEPPEVILIDLNMPGMHGIDAIREIRYNYPTVLTMVLTVSGSRRSVLDALKAGASGYLLKSDSFDRILQHIHEVVVGDIPLSSSVTHYILEVLKATPSAHEISELTEQELAILELLAEGYGRKAVADKLCLATATVDYHLQSIYRKLNVHSIAAAIGRGFRRGWLK